MKKLLVLLLFLSLLPWGAHAQSTATQVLPGMLAISSTGPSPNFVPLSSTTPLPVAVYDSGNHSGYCYTSNGSSSPATFQVCQSGDTEIALGTSASAANPYRTGDFGTGLYSAAASDVSIATGGVTAFDFPANDTTTGGSIAIGRAALKGLPSSAAYLNTSVGYESMGGIAGTTLTTAATNQTAVGAFALGSNTSGSYNTAIGENSMRVNTTGSSNDAVGWDTLVSNTTGKWNICMGNEACATASTLNSLTGIGDGALQNVVAGSGGDTGLGESALVTLGTGGQNTAVGYYSQFSATNVSDNTSIGGYSLYTNSIGVQNTATGYSALEMATNSYNTAYGYYALGNTGNAQNNFAAGYQAGLGNTTGQNNVFLGFQVGSSECQTGNDNLLIGVSSAIDCAATSTANTINIGGTGGSWVLVTGTNTNSTETTVLHGLLTLTNIGSDATHTDATVCEDTTSHTLYSGSGTLGVCLGTSRRSSKTNIHPIVDGIAEIQALKPVNFFYKKGQGDNGAREQYGFVAEDFAQVLPKLTRYDKNGKPMSVDLLGVVPIMVGAMQEQQTEIVHMQQYKGANACDQFNQIGKWLLCK